LKVTYIPPDYKEKPFVKTLKITSKID